MRRKLLPAAALPDRPAALGPGIASIMRSSRGGSQNLVSGGRRSAATAPVAGRNVETRNSHDLVSAEVSAEVGEPAIYSPSCPPRQRAVFLPDVMRADRGYDLVKNCVRIRIECGRFPCQARCCAMTSSSSLAVALSCTSNVTSKLFSAVCNQSLTHPE